MKCLFFAVMLAITGCTNDSERDSIPANNIAKVDQYLCSHTVQNFMGWYEDHFAIIDTLRIVNVHAKDGFYRVNFTNAEKYLDYLQGSNFFSKKFLSDKKAYFQKADDRFKIIQQVDDPAVGFEADLLLLSQEVDGMFKDRNKLKYSIANDKSHVIATMEWYGERRVFLLDKATCKIDSIYLAN